MSKLQAYNPWPTILRAKYDFDFENKLKHKVIDSLKASDRFIKSMNMATPEKNGGVTSVVLDQDPNYPMPHSWPEFDDFVFDVYLTCWHSAPPGVVFFLLWGRPINC